MKLDFKPGKEFAEALDQKDPLKVFRNEFQIPKTAQGEPCIYLCGNSLGLQPRKAKEYVDQELLDWANLGVEGHFHAKSPWYPYHEKLTESTARLVGAQPEEVVVMNSLSTNLHLMMVSFYRPAKKRFKIMIEGNAFPSDRYVVASQARFHGFDPSHAIVRLEPRKGENTLRLEDILARIREEGEALALVMLGNVNFLTGQAFDMKAIAQAAHAQGAYAGFDLAHGAGNLLMHLHQHQVDFAVWCSYKYLNAGPGAIAGCFIHQKHLKDPSIPRFEGWWGHDKVKRFQFGPDFLPMPSAEAWQLSNPPIFQMAALCASMEIFDQATMAEVRKKGDLLTGYLEHLLQQIPGDAIEIVTPSELSERGSQLSLRVRSGSKDFQGKLTASGVISDFREPDVLRVAPAPLYNTYSEMYRFSEVMRSHVG